MPAEKACRSVEEPFFRYFEVPRLVDAQQLVNAVAQLRPAYSPSEHLRIALLISTQFPDADFANADALERMCLDVTLQLSATSDQHAAVAGELNSLAATEPTDFTPNHMWTLVRALKIQSQILNLYLGPATTT